MATFFKDYLYYFIWSPFTIWASRNDANTGKCLIILPRFENKHLWYKVRRIWQTYIYVAAAAAVKSLQSCPTLCDPIDGSPPGSPVPGILQARTLEWVVISLSNAWKWKGKVKLLSRVRLLATPWTAAYQAPPSMRFSRQEYWFSNTGTFIPQEIFGNARRYFSMIGVRGFATSI